MDTYDDKVYAKAKELLDKMRNDGVYLKDADENYYIYELTMDGRSQTGLVACASIDDYKNNVIKKHENTRADKEADRIRHVDTCNAQTGPIFLAYRKNETVSLVIEKVKKTVPVYDFVSDDKIGHRVWVIDNLEDKKTIYHEFCRIDDIYIADGHHRAASAVKVGFKRREEKGNYTGDEEFNFFLSVLFPDEELMIMPYNRVVKDLNGRSKEAFLEEIRNRFDVEKKDAQVSPEKKGTFGMYLDNTWYLLTAKKELLSNDSVKGFDVSILQDYLLHPVLGIKDP